MEQGKSKKLISGLFIAIGLGIFIIAIFVIGNKQNLFTPTIKLHAIFEDVNGLKDGAIVRFNGIDIGSVDKIEIVSGNKVNVQMLIKNNIKQFIKKDSKAEVTTEGLVGNKILEITPGNDYTPSVNDGDFIATIKPFEAEDILKTLKETEGNAQSITKDLAEIMDKVNKGQGTLGEFVNNDTLYKRIDTIMMGLSGSAGKIDRVFNVLANNIDKVSNNMIGLTKNVQDVTGNIAEISEKIKERQSVAGTLLNDTETASDLKALIRNANQTTSNLEQGSFSFSQNMEALKHNFLFKGYFEDIGYWDKNEYEKNLDRLNQQLKMRQQELEEREKRINSLEQQLKDLQEKK